MPLFNRDNSKMHSRETDRHTGTQRPRDHSRHRSAGGCAVL